MAMMKWMNFDNVDVVEYDATGYAVRRVIGCISVSWIVLGTCNSCFSCQDELLRFIFALFRFLCIIVGLKKLLIVLVRVLTELSCLLGLEDIVLGVCLGGRNFHFGLLILFYFLGLFLLDVKF